MIYVKFHSNLPGANESTYDVVNFRSTELRCVEHFTTLRWPLQPDDQHQDDQHRFLWAAY